MSVVGEYDVCLIDERSGDWSPPLFTKKNLLLYSWGYIAAQAMCVGNLAFKVSSVYLEYKNVVNPGDPVPVPAFARSDGLYYYNNLPPNQDYLRVPLAATPTVDIASGFEPYFVSGFSGNRVTFTAQTTGAKGVRGLVFSDVAYSKVFGIALIATPVQADPTQDVILTRGYFNVNDQQLKQTGSQVGVRWRVSFK